MVLSVQPTKCSQVCLCSSKLERLYIRCLVMIAQDVVIIADQSFILCLFPQHGHDRVVLNRKADSTELRPFVHADLSERYLSRGERIFTPSLQVHTDTLSQDYCPASWMCLFPCTPFSISNKSRHNGPFFLSVCPIKSISELVPDFKVYSPISCFLCEQHASGWRSEEVFWSKGHSCTDIERLFFTVATTKANNTHISRYQTNGA